MNTRSEDTLDERTMKKQAVTAESRGSMSMPHRCKLYFFQLLAVVSLVLAFIGVFVPGLPTTEFVLLCAWSSAKGSPRIHR